MGPARSHPKFLLPTRGSIAATPAAFASSSWRLTRGPVAFSADEADEEVVLGSGGGGVVGKSVASFVAGLAQILNTYSASLLLSTTISCLIFLAGLGTITTSSSSLQGSVSSSSSSSSEASFFFVAVPVFSSGFEAGGTIWSIKTCRRACRWGGLVASRFTFRRWACMQRAR